MAETNTMDAAAFTAKGTERERVALPEQLFDGTVNMPVMHQAVKAYLANQRQGNAKTKTRGFVVGGNQKPWKQKGTGRARQGSIRAPQWVGGGTVFGPIPRSYAEYVPRQVRALARKSALNARARENAIIVIDAFNFEAPKTSQVVALIDRLDITDKKILILTDGAKTNVYLSGRNIRNVHVLPYSDVSTYHILWSDVVLIESSALGQTLEPVEEKEAAPRAKKPAKAKPADEGDEESRSVKGKKGGAKKSAAKSASKKPAAKKAAAKSASKKPAAKAKSAKPAAKKKKGK
jgi:large subunit ribosomal protein L4